MFILLLQLFHLFFIIFISGAVVKIKNVKIETYHRSSYHHISAIVHIEFPTNELNLKEITILTKTSCRCPELELNRFYFLIINKDQISRNFDDADEVYVNFIIIVICSTTEP